MAVMVGNIKTSSVDKRSSSSGKVAMVKTSSMNKSKKKSYKKYKGQGR